MARKATLFPMAKGDGLLGEAGPELVMPLKRGADGRLGSDQQEILAAMDRVAAKHDGPTRGQVLLLAVVMIASPWVAFLLF